MTTSEMEVDRSSATRVQSVCGRVETRLDGGLMRVVEAGQATVCRKAVGCLLEPCVGDRVALHDGGDGIAYVIAILERTSAEPARLRFDRPTILDIGGDFDLGVQGDTNLQCGQQLRLQAAQAVLNIESVELVAAAMQGLVGELGLKAGSLRLVAKAIDTVADRMVQVLGHSYRSVEGTDQLRAEQIDYAALEQLRLHARNALFTADQLSKIDADQIHLG